MNNGTVATEYGNLDIYSWEDGHAIVTAENNGNFIFREIPYHIRINLIFVELAQPNNKWQIENSYIRRKDRLNDKPAAGISALINRIALDAFNLYLEQHTRP